MNDNNKEFPNLVRLKARLKVAASLAVSVLIYACSGSDAPAPQQPAPIAVATPAPQQETYSLLKQEGTAWVNQQNEKVSLRGINLGNWLAMEMWMFAGPGQDESLGVGDQCTLEAVLTDRFNEAENQRLLDIFRDNWMTESDWDTIADIGFNLVRVPFLYNLIENDSAPMTLRDDAWKYLDRAIAAAKERELYVVLDLHGAVGRQGEEQHSGCAGINELWDNETYQARTAWLWQEIAKRYKDEPAIAGYGLLNEPWGTDPETMRDVVVDLYQAVREVDQQHIVILPGHNAAGIAPYGDPLVDYGMENIAFEIHQYPGLFGWGEIGYEVHRDWLTCGKDGTTGVCDWATRLRNVYSPVLIGETQPWASLGDLGGPITRASFDVYNELNWAATAWSYKTTSQSGGVSSGRWGLVTNAGDQLLVKGDTWACDDWESTFANACSQASRSTIPYPGEGTQSMYLVIKTGTWDGALDVVYDSISLVNDSTGQEVLVNGGFGSDASWTELSIFNDERTYDFNYAAGEFAGSDDGPALRVFSDLDYNNSMIYQEVQIEGGQSYTISGKFKDLAGTNMWAEIYLVPTQPVEGQDVQGNALNLVNVNEASLEEIETFFAVFGTMPYTINQGVYDAMTAMEAPEIFTRIPGEASGLSLAVSAETVGLTWVAAEGEVDGYKVFRSTAPRSGFSEIASVDGLTYTDTAVDEGITYYYYVAAFNDVDQGYASSIEASGPTFYGVPGRIEAENYITAHPGVNTETAVDDGGGLNIGNFEVGRWVDYDIDVATAGEYIAEFRLASLPGPNGTGGEAFEIRIGNTVIATVSFPSTGGWQEYETFSQTITLPVGQATMRLHSVSNQWNLNWMEFSAVAASN